MFDETLRAIGEKLVANCREGKEMEGLEELYAADAVSVEALPMPGSDSAELVGLDAIKGKHDWWNNAHEVHSSTVQGPFFHGADRFGAIFDIDVTQKENGERMKMQEIAVYTVANGKIVREEFFYNM